MVTQEFAPRHAGYPRAYSTREALGNQNVIFSLSTVPTELMICTSAATTWLESPFTGNRACSPKTPARVEPAKYCWNVEAAATVMLPGAMAVPEESKKLKCAPGVIPTVDLQLHVGSRAVKQGRSAGHVARRNCRIDADGRRGNRDIGLRGVAA